jgi:hypothetical protein
MRTIWRKFVYVISMQPSLRISATALNPGISAVIAWFSRTTRAAEQRSAVNIGSGVHDAPQTVTTKDRNNSRKETMTDRALFSARAAMLGA